MEKAKMKKMVIILVGVLVIVTIGIFLIISGDINRNDTSNNTDVTAEAANEVPDVVTDTPYCELHFPGKWKDDVSIENSKEEPYTVDYYGKADGEKYLLFSLVFGESDGFCLGTITTNDGDVDIHIVEGKLDNIGDLNDDEQQLLYDMQINVNYIIQNLEKEENFKIS